MISYSNTKKALFTPLVRWATLFCIVSSLGLLTVPAGAAEILVGTGKDGTFSNFTGRTLERIISGHAGEMTCRAIPADDDIDNLTNLVQGSLDLSLVDARTVQDVINKKGLFEFIDISYENLRVLMPLYDVPITLVVRDNAEIKSLDDLRGKRINAAAPRSPRSQVMKTIMQIKAWSQADFSLVTEISGSLSQDSMAFCYGTIQAMLHMGVHPDSALQHLIQNCKAELVGLNDGDIVKLVADNPAYTMTTIAANTYPSQPQPVETLAITSLLVASEDLDEQTAYAVIEALYNNQQRLQSAHPRLSTVATDADRKEIPGITRHPGAVRFLKDR